MSPRLPKKFSRKFWKAPDPTYVPSMARKHEEIEMTKPTYYSVKEVAEIFSRDPHTIRDWIRFGCPTPAGRIRLEAAKLGKSWAVRDEWLAVFELRVRPQDGRPDLAPE